MMPTKELTNELLKSKMTDTAYAKGTVEDFNTCFAPGLYTAYPHTTVNFPPNAHQYGLLKVEVSDAYCLQTYIERTDQSIMWYRTFVRVDQTLDTFRPWVKLIPTV